MSAVKPTAEQLREIADIKVSEDDECPECFRCGDTYCLRDGTDDTGLCDPCAQLVVLEMRPHIYGYAASLDSHRQPESAFDPGELEWAANLLDLRDPLSGKERETVSAALRAYAKLLRGERE